MDYKISVNGTTSQPSSDYADISARWSRIAGTLEGRGGHAVLYRRDSYHLDILPGLAYLDGWIITKTSALSPWEIAAEINQ